MPKRLAITGPTPGSNLANKTRPRDDPNAPWRWFESQKAAARALGVAYQNISKHLKGNPNYTHVGGFIFRRAV